MTNTQPLWQPSAERITATNMYQFMQTMNAKHGLAFHTYEHLHQWSITESPLFWDEIWQLADIQGSIKGNARLSQHDKMLDAQWFPEAKLNFAENLLRFRDDRIALVFRGEDGKRQCLTYAELYLRVAQLAAGLKSLNVVAGDRVAGFMPNVIDTVVAMLATTSIGAVWTSCSPDFGINGVLDRFGQVEPKVLFTTDGYLYNGKVLDSLARVGGIASQLPSLEKIVVCDHITKVADLTTLQTQCHGIAIHLHAFSDPSVEHIDFTQMAFNDPLYIMYSSGTTGVPKCIIHSIGGTLLQHQKELRLHTNVNRDDVLFYYTTCGWMMWNWLVSGLATGCSILLYDGSPFKTPDIMMDIAEQERISIFGTSAKYIAALEKADVKPRQTHDLTALHSILTTGSPLAHESFEFVYRDIKTDVLLASISGGTDIISCFVLGCPILPVYPGQLQCAGLGMAVDIFDVQGQPVRGEKGELVCTQPFPSMPIGFWDDPDQEKYRAAYFSQFDNVWAHGDYAEITSEHGIIIHGRSDAVLNPGGVRIGTAEIYRQVETIKGVQESIVIGQDWQDDVRVVLFVVLKPNYVLNDHLVTTIKQQIRTNTTPRHVPAKIIQVSDIPRTISGKIVELAVRHVIHNQAVTNQDALANPEALSLFANLDDLKT